MPTSSTSQPLPSTPAPDASCAPRVLVVEDNEDIRRLIAGMLSMANYEVITASNGIEGLAAARRFQPSVIVMDILMPEQDGFETLLELRRERFCMPVIAISGGGMLSHRDTLNSARCLGAARVLAKPFTSDELLDCVHSVCRGP